MSQIAHGSMPQSDKGISRSIKKEVSTFRRRLLKLGVYDACKRNTFASALEEGEDGPTRWARICSVSSGFIWHRSPEPHGFWSNIDDKITRM